MKILLVEDTEELAKVILGELNNEGYETLYTGDGESALSLFHEEKPDLVLLDWGLPKMSGIDVLKKIRRDSYTPVLMLTARGDEIDKVLGLEMGADDYLTKPFSQRELLARIKALIRRIDSIKAMVRRDRETAAENITYRNLRYHRDENHICMNNKPLSLTAMELSLLTLFMSHPGRTFSRNYLIETLWGADSAITDRAVDNAVLRLRKKLGENGDSIATVWGLGYKLVKE